jgi:hypothetical protein
MLKWNIESARKEVVMVMRLSLCAIAIALLAIVASCSNSKSTEPILPADTAVVSGKVMAAWCIPWVDPPLPEWFFPYTEQTGLQATVQFFGHAGKQQTAVTNVHSAYSVEIDTGIYTIVVETWHGWPYRFINVHIGHDTILDPAVFLSYQWPDTVICGFSYRSAEDSLTEQEERGQLVTLNQLAGAFGAYDAMVVESAVRYVSEYTQPYYKSVSYYVNPRPGWYVWQIVDAGRATLAAFEDRFADGLNVDASYIICFDDKAAPQQVVTIDCGQ